MTGIEDTVEHMCSPLVYVFNGTWVLTCDSDTAVLANETGLKKEGSQLDDSEQQNCRVPFYSLSVSSQ